jgi:citrate/tricarballylate utilization protein
LAFIFGLTATHKASRVYSLIAVSGLMLYFLGTTVLMPTLLVLHLGAVLAFFVLTPFTKMAHGFYRMAALVRDAQRTG